MAIKNILEISQLVLDIREEICMISDVGEGAGTTLFFLFGHQQQKPYPTLGDRTPHHKAKKKDSTLTKKIEI